MASDFGLAQILPLADEENDTESKVIHASFADPYLLLVKEDHTITILYADESGDLYETQRGEGFDGLSWISGCLYDDSNDVLRLEFNDEEEVSNVLLFLLSANGSLHVSILLNIENLLRQLAK